MFAARVGEVHQQEFSEVKLFSYEGGVAVAFLLWLYSVVALLVALNSTYERNLNRIGQRTSWFTLLPKEMSAEDSTRTPLFKSTLFLLACGIGLISTLLSWLYLAAFAAQFVYRKSKDAGAPVAVKDFRWKLRNTEMSFDQLVKELMKVSELDPASFEVVREERLFSLRERGLSISTSNSFFPIGELLRGLFVLARGLVLIGVVIAITIGLYDGLSSYQAKQAAAKAHAIEQVAFEARYKAEQERDKAEQERANAQAIVDAKEAEDAASLKAQRDWEAQNNAARNEKLAKKRAIQEEAERIRLEKIEAIRQKKKLQDISALPFWRN